MGLGQDFGRIFEVGFNAGLLTAMQQRNMALPPHVPYYDQLGALRLGALLDALCSAHNIVSDTDRARVRDWLIWYVFRGWIAGQTLWHEYLDALGERTLPHIRYVQAQFTDENSLHTHAGGTTAKRALLGQLPWPNVDAVLQGADDRGLFLKADTLVWLAGREQDWLLVIDLSAFQIAMGDTLPDLQDIEVLRRMLQQEIAYQQSRSAFADLSLDFDPLV